MLPPSGIKGPKEVLQHDEGERTLLHGLYEKVAFVGRPRYDIDDRK